MTDPQDVPDTIRIEGPDATEGLLHIWFRMVARNSEWAENRSVGVLRVVFEEMQHEFKT